MDKTLKEFSTSIVKHSTDKVNKFHKFFYSSRSHVIIVMEVAQNTVDKIITFEFLCARIPRSICSRGTIKNILNEGRIKGFFLKTPDTIDKRKKTYKLSNNSEKIMISWVKKSSFAIFMYYRIALGIFLLIYLNSNLFKVGW